MNIEALKQIDKRYRIEKPRLFEIDYPDGQASDEQLEDVERSLGVRLPPSYRTFLREFGGGTYGFIVIFSADPQSEWYLPNKQMKASRYLPKDLLAFSDDFAAEIMPSKLSTGRLKRPCSTGTQMEANPRQNFKTFWSSLLATHMSQPETEPRSVA